jgi:D-alanyl-D-alanine carboxypeptidase (penicillin-binding protein 5/6)
VRDLILGLIVLSGGDASMVVAEKLAGSETQFTAMMEKKARSIGMEQSTFGNASGLPNPNNLMTSRELAILAQHLIADYPDIYPLFATKRFEFKEHKTDWCREWGRTHTLNYNKLLFNMRGADGLKTGHTSEAGYCLTGSVVRGDRRLIQVVAGLESNKERFEETESMMTWGFANYDNYKFFNKNE